MSAVYCPARGGEAAAAEKTPKGMACRYCGGLDHRPVNPCNHSEAHAAHLAFFGECTWCGEVDL